MGLCWPLYNDDRGVDFRVPVIIRQDLFSCGSTLWALQDLVQTRAQYSDMAVCLRISGSAPQLVLASLLRRLFLVDTFCFNFFVCSRMKVSYQVLPLGKLVGFSIEV